ncbi:MAG: hypothetical protein J0G30_10615 [Actinomycetales bacterium]|nr:hypothetical protein [Actinomycetales bacterium]
MQPVPPTRRSIAAVALAASAATIALALAGCVESPAPEPTTTRPSSTAPPASPAPTAPPTYDPEGSAADNQAYFDHVIAELVATNPNPKGRDLIDALVNGGFDKSAMEVTPDETSVRLDADAIQFSVRIGDDCLIGDWGGGTASSTVLPVLPTGTCLVGTTRPIDW